MEIHTYKERLHLNPAKTMFLILEESVSVLIFQPTHGLERHPIERNI